jgi:serine phosphatase RsbU (regulator of sigma subunit)
VADRGVIVGAAERPHPGEAVSGDGWALDWHAGRCRLAVVDGLGHGPPAAAAARAALDALAARPDLAPDEALRLCHAALNGTRGAAMSVARLDPAAARLTYAGVGNVEARLWRAGAEARLIAYRGILGTSIRTLRAFDFDLGSDWLLVLYTDGVSTRFDLGELADAVRGDPQALANALLERWGRAHDDATVVALRSAPPEAHRPQSGVHVPVGSRSEC